MGPGARRGVKAVTSSFPAVCFGIFNQRLSQALVHHCIPRTPRAVLAVISLFYLRYLQRFAKAVAPAALNPKPRNRRRLSIRQQHKAAGRAHRGPSCCSSIARDWVMSRMHEATSIIRIVPASVS